MKISPLHIIPLLLYFLALPLGAQVVEPATLLGSWTRNDLPGSITYDNTYNEIWGLALNDKEYAVIGSTLGTHFIDVTIPEDAKEIAFVEGASSGANIIHRDYHNFGCYLYAVSDEGSGSLQIMDVSTLPDSVTVVYDKASFFTRSHNIFIDTAQAILYACAPKGGSTTASPLKLYDISNPIDPQELASYNEFGSGVVSHVHDCYVENGLAFLNLGFDGMAMVDFSDPLRPQRLSTSTDYPFAGYNHSGWPTTDLQYYYLGDESHGFPLKIMDVSDRSEIEVINTFDADSPNELSIPHNQIVACDYLYVSYYYDGLQVYNISDPTRPERVSYFNTSSKDHRSTYEGAWGVYPFLPSGNILVSDMQEGLFIVSGPEGNCDSNEQMRLNCDFLSPVSPIESAAFEFSIFPQPANDYLQLEIETIKGQEKVNVSLLDIHGRPLQRWEERSVSSTTLALNLPEALANGLYLLRIQIGKKYITKKVLIHQ